MGRRTPAKQTRAAAAGSSGAADKPNTPFAGLRQRIRAAQASEPDAEQRPPAPRIRPARIPSPKSEPDSRPDAADLELFHAAVGKVQPVGRSDRAFIERPRPAPLPRQVAEEASPADPGSPQRTETDPLRLAYAGVVPLRDNGRVELETAYRHQAPQPSTARAGRIQRPDAILLPADADLSDPSALFRSVVGDAQPVADRNRVEIAPPAPPPAPIKREADERAALHESLAAPLTFEDRLDMGEEAAFLRPGLPRRVLTDLRRGRWVLQGQIDLHGLTRDEARAALAHFLHDALAQGKRCIRVIHGKGHGSPGKVSILKQLSRGWLAQREEILAFCQAGPHDGGGGALLVLLRAQNASSR